MIRWARRIGLVLTALFALLGGMIGCMSLPQPVQEATPDTLRIATYNVHYIWLDRQTGDWSVGDWERRRGPLQAAFASLDADIVGFQEMESFSRQTNDQNLTLDWLRDNNPDYAVAAVGDPSVFPSTQPIFYRSERLELVDQGWFFFSPTPDVIYARTYNGSFPAYTTWAEFRDGAGDVFRVYNLHTDFGSRMNRELSLQLVAERIAEPATRMPVFVIGDFNELIGSRRMQPLKEAGVKFWPVQGTTYHFNSGLNLFPAIDHIGATGGVEVVGETFSVRGRFDGEWPTDHYPVVGDFRLP